MKAPCGQEDCDCGHTIERLVKALEVVRLGFKYIMEGQVLDAVYLLRDSPQAKALDYTDLLWAMWQQQSATSQEVADILEAIARAAIKVMQKAGHGGSIVNVASVAGIRGSGSAIPYGIGMNCAPISELETRYYIRMVVVDKPNTLGAISTLFGEAAVGLAAMEMRTLENDQGEIVFLTHRCFESDFVRALADVRKLAVVHSVESWFRVEE
ncbi:MAG: hypothetical protein IIB17_05550 [Chloroflexi bacterium]|nr:hypothetical protein [Chloroflexota bacterium]